MLNIEMYKDELENLGVLNLDELAVIDGKPELCIPVECSKCDFCKKDGKCEDGEGGLNKKSMEWLLSEYKEPEIDWSKVKVDTPILVKEYDCDEWSRRYFAEYDEGRVYAWRDGATSWSAVDERCWNYVKLAESEEQ